MPRTTYLLPACALALCLALLLAAGPAVPAGGRGEAPELAHGLLWRDSSLAAVFPLVVKTPPGRDFYLRVEGAGSGHVVLAAGIRGGRFFRVLVPNGGYRLDFAHGTDWRGEEALFAPGPKAGRLRIETPLRFGVHGLGRKAGHVVTLSEGADGLDVAIKGQGLCQRVSTRLIRPAPGETRVPGVDLDGAIPVPGPYNPPRAPAMPAEPGAPITGMPYLVHGIRTVVCD